MAESIASKIQYSELCEVYEKISKAKGNKKIEELRKFIDSCRRTGREMKRGNSTSVRIAVSILLLFFVFINNESECIIGCLLFRTSRFFP